VLAVNRRGFIASLLAAPFVPAPLKALVHRVTPANVMPATKLDLAKFAQAKRALMRYDAENCVTHLRNGGAITDLRAEYIRGFNAASRRFHDQALIEELSRG
jgi:hypothetical protein